MSWNSWKVSARYAVMGVVMAGMWASNAGEPLIQHAAKFVAIGVLGPLILARALQRRARRAGRVRQSRRSIEKATAFRVVVVFMALLASAFLRSRVHDADYMVAVGIFFFVTLLGPRLDGSLGAAVRPARTAAESSAEMEGN
ncbi:hypothetical protein ACGF5O_46720 [Streptomyces sp. NPDC048291]|uniref:hypothetical protein n=1 Tax=Streptomyces sp. NPDC048291 TaxID=3365530 RepID=UPI003723A773